jgi:predicted chitinase
MLTTEQLHAIMPGLPAAKGATLYPFLTAAVAEFGIEAPARTAAFLAQLAHESAQFRFMEEIWGPTAAQRRYEPPGKLAATLGNTEPGDGRRFKGRGPIQITGRANYRRFGDLLDLDLVADPVRAADPAVAFRIAGLFWSKKRLNELADEATIEAFREITRRINGGFNGLADRVRFYEAARAVLGVAAPPATRGGVRPPRELEDPAFERGFEAIRADVARRRRRKARPEKQSGRRRPAASGRGKEQGTRKKAGVPKKTGVRKKAARPREVSRPTRRRRAAR